MNKVRKYKNIIIASFILFMLGDKTFKLVKGNNYANQVILEHSKNTNHIENIVAHRGFSGLYKENTLESIKEALNLDCVDMIEIDIRYTKNNIFVLHHDKLIDLEDFITEIEEIEFDDIDSELITKKYPHFNVDNLFYDDTLFLFKRFLNSKSDEDRIVSLNKVLKTYDFKKPLILDIKTSSVNYNMMHDLNNLIQDYKDKIFIQSDYFPFLNNMIKLYPDYNYLYIIKSFDSIKNQNDDFVGYTIRYGLLNQVRIKPDKMYLIYTINSRDKYLNLLSNKKYRNNMYIITDNPDYICSLLESKKLRK